MRQFLRNNGLTLTLLALFIMTLAAQALTGWRAHAEELKLHNLPEIGLGAYLTTGHFISAVFENWESEFLQMAAYVLLTAYLVQRGSPESKDPDEPESGGQIPACPAHLPWPVRRGGFVLKLYSHSLSLALATLFLVSFWLHLVGSNRNANEQVAQHQQPQISLADTAIDPQFWYESFQNWQSEFLSIAVLLVLGIFLRERGSPQSKPVTAAHSKTGP